MRPGKRTGIELFHHDDARIVAEFPGELPVTDIDRIDLRRAMLEQAIGESAGRGSEIEGDFVLCVDGEFFQGVFEFESAAADIPLPT